MKWRGIGALALSIVLFAGMAAASPITITSPTSKVYSDDDSIKINLESQNGYNLTNYSILTADISEDISGTSFIDQQIIPQGDHKLDVYANDGSNTKSKHVDFTVDTEGPVITSTYPEDTVFERYPELNIAYEDEVSSIDTSSVQVWLDGTEVTDEGNVSDSAFTLPLSDVNVSEGEHDVAVEVSDTQGNTPPQTQWSFTIPKNPVLQDASPEGLVDGSDATAKLTAKDPSGIDTSKSRFKLVRDSDGRVLEKVAWDEAENVNSIDSGVTVKQSFSDLDDGTYVVEAEVMDDEGNEATTTWEFTVDTTPPSVDIRSHSDGDVVKGTQTVTAEAADEYSAVDRVKMALAGETEFVETATNDKFNADIDTTKVADGLRTLDVAAYDEAENRESTSIELMVDNTAPAVSDIEVYPKTVSAQGRVLVTVEDAATGVDTVSYKIQDTGLSGTLVPEDGAFDDSVEDAYGVLDVSSLDAGTYTVQVIAEDGAGHATTAELPFTVDHSLSTDLTLQHEGTVLVDADSSKTFAVRVANNGDADDLVRISSGSPLVTGVQPEEKRIQAGETKGFDVTVDVPTNTALGPRDVPVTLHSLGEDVSADLSVSVQPTSTMQQEIEQRVQELEEEYTDLTESKQEYDDQVNAETAGETFDETQSLLDDINTKISEGRYYAASQQLDEAESQVSEAETALTGMVSRYKKQQLISTVLKVFAVLLLAGIAFGAYRLAPGEEGFDNEQGFVMHEDDRHLMQRTWDDTRQAVQDKVAELQQNLQGGSQDTSDTKEKDSGSQRPQGWSGFEN